MKLGSEIVATFGEVHPAVAADYGIDDHCYIAEIAIDKLYKLEAPKVTYKPLPRFPAVERDLALVCDIETPAGVLDKAIRDGAGRLCENVRLFDIYTGSQVAEGKKSMAYRLTLRSAESTLNDEMIDKTVAKIIKKLEAVGAAPRV